MPNCMRRVRGRKKRPGSGHLSRSSCIWRTPGAGDRNRGSVATHQQAPALLDFIAQAADRGIDCQIADIPSLQRPAAV